MAFIKPCSKLNRDLCTSFSVILFHCEGLIYLGQGEASVAIVNVVVVEPPSHVRLFCNPMDCSLPDPSVHGIS